MTKAIDREREFYGAALGRATSGAASTGYGMEYNQTMRFEQLVKQLELFGGADQHFTMLDMGSGTGDLYVHLTEAGLEPESYVGYDILPEMTAQAEKNLTEFHEDGAWDLRTGTAHDALDEYGPCSFDYAVSIAAYALKEEHESQMEYMQKVQGQIRALASMANRACFVTLFSTWKTNIIPEEMVLDPVTVFAWAKSEYERVDLIHSYAPFDFSLVIWNEKSQWRKEWEAHTGLQEAARRLKDTVVSRA